MEPIGERTPSAGAQHLSRVLYEPGSVTHIARLCAHLSSRANTPPPTTPLRPLDAVPTGATKSHNCGMYRCNRSGEHEQHERARSLRLMESPAALTLAELARARERGARFADCWPRAVARACSEHPDPGGWLEALAATRGAWERAFLGQHAHAEEALSLVREERNDPAEPERTCALSSCNGDMAARAPQARYCSPRCARRAAYIREHPDALTPPGVQARRACELSAARLAGPSHR